MKRKGITYFFEKIKEAFKKINDTKNSIIQFFKEELYVIDEDNDDISGLYFPNYRKFILVFLFINLIYYMGRSPPKGSYLC